MGELPDFASAVEYLYTLRRAGIKLDLAPVLQGFQRLGNPQLSYDTLHVAGTNGKGTTCTLLAAFLQGFRRVGLFTSPHLIRFAERIRVQGEPISDTAFLTHLRHLREQLPSFSFFETATAMAFLEFQRQGVEVAVVEAGLGGRLDSTGVIDPSVTVLTSIGGDHALALSSSHERVLWEKCGILRPGVSVVVPALCAPLAHALERHARALGARVFREGREFFWRVEGERFSFARPGHPDVVLPTPFVSVAQNRSLALALQALALYLGELPSLSHLERVTSTFSVPGRLERQGRFVLDGAHNPSAVGSLARVLSSWDLTHASLLVGLNRDKDLKGVLQPLLRLFRRVYTAPVGSERGVSPTLLGELVRRLGGTLSGVVTTLDHDALSALQGNPVLVTGSFYLVGAVRKLLLRSQGDAFPLTDPAL